MIDQQLLNFIKEHREYLQNENSKREMKSSLLAQGWPSDMIDEAMFQVSAQMNVPQYQPPTQFSTPRPTIQQPAISPVATPSSVPQISSAASLPGPLALLSEAFAIFMRRPLTFLSISLILSLISSFYTMVGIWFKAAYSAGSVTGSAIVGSLFGLLLIIPIVALGSTWSTIALIHAIKGFSVEVGIAEFYRRGINKIFSFWWIGLLVASMLLGGLLLLIIPGIIFFVWFGLAGFILIAEDIKGLDALLKSKEYVRGFWWQVCGRDAVIVLLTLLFGGFLLIFNIIFGKDWGRIIYGFSVQLVMTPLALIYTFLIYSHLRAIKGEVVITASNKQKLGFKLIGAIGALVIPAMIVAAILLASLNSAREKANNVQLNIANVEQSTATSTGLGASASAIGNTITDCGLIAMGTNNAKQVEECFNSKFQSCVPAQKIISLDLKMLGGSGVMDMQHRIGGRGAGLCGLEVKYLKHPKPEVVGHGMTCDLDNKLAFDAALRAASKDNKSCRQF